MRVGADVFHLLKEVVDANLVLSDVVKYGVIPAIEVAKSTVRSKPLDPLGSNFDVWEIGRKIITLAQEAKRSRFDYGVALQEGWPTSVAALGPNFSQATLDGILDFSRIIRDAGYGAGSAINRALAPAISALGTNTTREAIAEIANETVELLRVAKEARRVLLNVMKLQLAPQLESLERNSRLDQVLEVFKELL